MKENYEIVRFKSGWKFIYYSMFGTFQLMTIGIWKLWTKKEQLHANDLIYCPRSEIDQTQFPHEKVPKILHNAWNFVRRKIVSA